MLRGIESAKEGMLGAMTLNDVLANNLANINTPGFKQSKAVFKDIHDIMIKQVSNKNTGDEQSVNLGSISAGSNLDTTVFDFKQGSLKITGNPLDIAISGNGFFTVKTPSGEAYTRNGNFILNQKGEITTQEGYPVIGSGGPITLDIKASDLQNINITAKGDIEVNKKIVNRLQIADFPNKNILKAMGDSLYVPNGNVRPQQANSYQLTQGSLETSNGNVVETMISSITGMRTYDALAQNIQTQSKMLGKSVTEVGAVRV